MPFFGRQREKWVAESIIGTRVGSACLFVGEPGVGKSALARDIVRDHDTAVVVVNPNERMWPYSGLSAVAAGLGGARGAAVDGVLARGRDWPEHLLAEELSRTLHLLHDDPCVLVVDDLDEMDASSITVLSFVFGRLRGTGISLIATVSALDGRHDFAGLAHTGIEPLTFGESVDLTHSTLGPSAARAVLHIVAAFTGGNPDVISRVRLTPDQASGDAPLPLPLRLADDATRRRRSTRPSPDPATSALLDLLSVGPVFGHDLLRVEARSVGLELDDLVESGLVSVHGELARVADPALRLRHHAALSADERRRLHAHAAEVHAGKYPATHQWHASFLDPEREGGLRLLVAAADLARHGDAASAVEFAERGLTEDLDPAARSRCLVDLGDALVRQGYFVLGQHYLRRAGRSDDPGVRAVSALAQLRAGAVVDHIVEDEVITPALAQSRPVDAERLLTETARIRLGRGELDQAVDRIAAAVELGVAANETALLARILEECGVENAMGTCAAVGTTLARTAGDAPVEEASLLATLYIVTEDYPSARRVATSLLDRTPRIEPIWRERVLRLLVACEVRAGDASAARDAVAAWRREWLPGRAPDAGSVLLLASAAALDPDGEDVDDLVQRGRALCRREGTPALLPWFAVVEGGQALARGRAAEAVTALQAARDAQTFEDPSLLRAEADLVEALWADGRADDARRELDALERAAARRPRRWSTLAIARARAVCRSDRAGAAAFREAEAMYRTDDAPDEHLRLLAARERCLSDVDATRPTTPSSRPAPPQRTRTLTAQENEVVAMVGQGLRNREIAAALYISLRTVELRLTNIYRKLGVASRVHLVAMLHGSPTR